MKTVLLIILCCYLVVPAKMHAQTQKTPTTGLALVGMNSSGTLAPVDDALSQQVFSGSTEEAAPQNAVKALGCHCFGKIVADCYETGALGSKYSLGCNTQTHYPECCDRVKAAAAALTPAQKSAIQSCVCAKGLADNTPISITAAIGTQGYQTCSDGQIGTYHQKPAYDVTVCKCPTGWLANKTNVDGGVTPDGVCKRQACTFSGPAACKPADGTQLGTWGFSWGNSLWEYGTACNGGKAACTTTHYPKGPCSITWKY